MADDATVRERTDEDLTGGYSRSLLDHCNNPRNVGSWPVDDDRVGTAWVEAVGCQDVVRLQVRIDPSTSVIVEARFKTFGCGPAIASSSLATEWLTNCSIAKALEIDHRDLAAELALPPHRVRCAAAVETAIGMAIADVTSTQRE